MDVLVTSPWIPVEWIEAHGLQARGAWFASGSPEVAVPEGVCAFAQALRDLVERQPTTPMILSTACDPMRRTADTVAAHGAGNVFLFNLPATWQSAAARRLYRAEVERLGRFLVRWGGRAPTAAQLESVIRTHNERRARLLDFLMTHPARESAEALRCFFTDGSWAMERELTASNHDGVPLAVVGGPLVVSSLELLKTIAAAGGNVVLNATEPGERCVLPPLPEPGFDDPLVSALADHYFDHIVDVFPRPNSRLYDWLSPRLAQRGVRGIVVPVQVGCDLWRAEAASLHEAFGRPVLMLEPHQGPGGALRESGRLAAFVESLQ